MSQMMRMTPQPEPCEGEVTAGSEADDYDDETYDNLINAELLLP